MEDASSGDFFNMSIGRRNAALSVGVSSWVDFLWLLSDQLEKISTIGGDEIKGEKGG